MYLKTFHAPMNQDFKHLYLFEIEIYNSNISPVIEVYEESNNIYTKITDVEHLDSLKGYRVHSNVDNVIISPKYYF